MKKNLLAIVMLALVCSGQGIYAAAAKGVTATATPEVKGAAVTAAPVATATVAPLTDAQKKSIADAQAAYDAASKKFVDATAAVTTILGDPAKTKAATDDGSLAKLVTASQADEKEVNDKLQVLNAAKAAAGIK